MTTINSNEFHVTFALSKTKMFSVSYYTLGSNSHPYFTTSAEVFNRPKSDYNRCGQCQEDVLKDYRTALNFYRKWDEMHLKELSEEEYTELLEDLEKLFTKYPYELEEKEGDRLRNISFNRVKDFSMHVYR